MQTFLTVLHVIICLLLLTVILLQPGKSGMGGALGGTGGGGTFGAKSPTTILSRFTVVMAVAFMVSSLTLAWLSVRDHSVQIDLGDEEDTHYPTPGLSLPGDRSLPEAEEGEAPDSEGPMEGSDEPEVPAEAPVPEQGSDEDAASEQMEGYPEPPPPGPSAPPAAPTPFDE